MTRPDSHPTTDLIYDRDLPEVLTGPDPDNAWAMLHLLNATGRLLGIADDIGGGAPGYGTTYDAATSPAVALPWLALHRGVRFPAGLDTAAQRQRIIDRPNARRGTPDYVIAAALAETADPEVGVVRLLERTEWPTGDHDGRFRIRLYEADIADGSWESLPADLTWEAIPPSITWSALNVEGLAAAAAVEAGKPAHLAFEIEVQPGPAADELPWETGADIPPELTGADLAAARPGEL